MGLCVRRATYWCPEMKAEDPAKKGVCSNFLCDSSPGDELKLTGPSGKVMLIPEEKSDVDLIMVATGTGIAPYRSFIRRLFVEKTPYGAVYSGLAWRGKRERGAAVSPAQARRRGACGLRDR